MNGLRATRSLALALSLIGVTTVMLSSSSGCSTTPEDELRNCDVPALFASSCDGSGCHGSEDPRANLDLVSPGVDQRLFHVLSTDDCGERKLVVPGHPDQSLLYEKVSKSKPSCGKRMPVSEHLSSTELACLKDYIERAGTDVEVENCETCGGILCVDSDRDPQNCGGCGQACDAGKICAEGNCINPCADGEELCGASCVTVADDENHCGSCNHRCGPGSSCQAGACSCTPPDDGAGGASGSTTVATFAADILPLFENSCSGSDCHTEESREAPLGLDPADAYDHLVNVDAQDCSSKKLVVPGDPDSSYLLDKLLGGALCEGGQMPLASEPLPTAATAKVVSWICDGAPNN